MRRALPARARSEIVTALLQFMAGTGVSPAQMRAAAGLHARDLLDPDRMIEIDRLGQAVELAAAELRDPALGLHVGAQFDLEALGLLTYAVLNADTVGTGLGNLVRFLGVLVHGVEPRLSLHRGVASLRVRIPGLTGRGARHVQEAGILLALRMLRRLIGDEGWRPRRIVLAHPAPKDVREHRRLFGVSPRFGGRLNEIQLDADVLEHAVPDADRSLLPVVERRLQEVLLRTEGEEPWLADLRVQVASRLCDGHPSLPRIAAQIGIGDRTLRRRLARRGIAYRDLVQRARRQLALRYLEETDTELTEIALLLGYSEVSAFHHAFSRWMGRSPGAHRRLARRRGAHSTARALPERAADRASKKRIHTKGTKRP